MTSPSITSDDIASHSATLSRFDSFDVARQYPSNYGQSFRDRREVACIKAALRHVRPGSHVLDLPCGSGRIVSLLARSGFRVTAADSSLHMLNQARRRYELACEGPSPATPSIQFERRDALNTGFADGQFDAVICNRLFHHFTESQTRVAALKELRRISRGPIIVSIFDSFAVDAVRFRLKHFFRGTIPNDRIPISARVFNRDALAAGLEISSSHAVMWGFSPMWMHVLQVTADC